MKSIRSIALMVIIAGLASCENKNRINAYQDGDEFTAQTIEGIDMLFKVISAADKIVQVGNGDSKEHPLLNELAAIDQQFEGKVTIPQEVNGFRVTRISKCAFFKCKIAKAEIPEGIIILNEDAFFDCENLKEIVLPNSLTTIEGGAFYNCKELASIHIPQNVDFLSTDAFYRTALRFISVDQKNKKYNSPNNSNAIIETSTKTLIKGCCNTIIPEDIEAIGDKAFYGCVDLTSIQIPSSVKTIGKSAFAECKLTKIQIPENVIKIAENAFYGNTLLKEIAVDENNPNFDSRNNSNAIVETLTNTLVLGCKNSKIPNDIKAIGDNAFHGCSDLKNIIIPCSVESIRKNAFSGCGLVSVTIPSNVKDIGEFAFAYCFHLEKILLSEGVEHIGDQAFESTNIQRILIPASVGIIGNGVFKDCFVLESIIVDSRNTRFDSRHNCNAIILSNTNSLRAGCMNTIIPDDVTKIEEDAFGGFAPSHIVIPSAVTEIGEHALGGGGNVVISLILEPFDVPEITITPIDTLYVPQGTKEKYEKYWGRKRAKNIVELKESFM
ncbi:MAG: leucine-rich repeat domain-containing protein [Bacteroidaceae bacterium]|nr:leucine-rich repeat domain-containing protein [Bacteroidaceae bacterium]